MLKADRTYNLNGVTVNEYLLTKHNPNGIAMPQYKITDLIGITVHNTERIVVSGTTMAEQYTRATVNGNMGDVRVHFYVDDTCAWQNLPLDLSGWHAADGDGDGNRKTIAIECIMNGSGDARDKKAEENCARLVAGLLMKFSLKDWQIYSHNHWYSRKYCPAYILPHWNDFRAKVKGFMKAADPPLLDKTGYKKGSDTIGSYGVKLLLLLARDKKLQPHNMDVNSCCFGDGTEKAVNYLLKKWGYRQNGIAGKNFEKRLYEELKKAK